MGEVCRAFHTPVTGGNVSFYNEDPDRCVFPTPVIGMVGLIDEVSHITTSWFKSDGDLIYLLGEPTDELGASEYFKTIHGLTTGTTPRLDLSKEIRLHEALYDAITRGWVRSAHDVSDGGFAVALAESCLGDPDHPRGAVVTLEFAVRADALLFGEGQSRALVSVSPETADEFEARMREQNQPCRKIGTVGGDMVRINNLIALPIREARNAWCDSLQAIAESLT